MKDRKVVACVISSYAYINEHINFGALLQYFALEKALENYGISTYWLRFCLREENTIKHRAKRYIKKIMNPTIWKSIDNVLDDFKIFIDKYTRVSNRIYYSERELEEYFPLADIYITGSDQVWGGIIKPNYLCFVPDRCYKISYAASFGKASIDSNHAGIIAPWLKRFNQISVREQSGVNICDKLGVYAHWVLDPTLLINKNDYPIIQLECKAPDIFGYFLNIESVEDIYWKEILTCAESKSLTLKVACTENTITLFDEKYGELIGPEEWLAKYSNARYILSNTFHGAVFAIIFHKKFIVMKQQGIGSKQNERLESLLYSLGLEDRFYSPEKTIASQLEKDICWRDVDEKLKERRKESYAFIQECMLNIVEKSINNDKLE